MKRSEFEKIMEESSFDDAMEHFWGEKNCVTTYEALKSFVIQKIKEDYYRVALHIWNAIYDSKGDSDWFYYDYCAGTTCVPAQLNNIDDVEQYIGFDKED